MELGPGSVVGGRYAIERRLGAGGVGQVWAGRRLDDGEPVAIKLLLSASSVQGELVARFKREAKFLSRIQSEYVARVLDFLSDPEHGLVLVLELIDGEALSEVLRHGRLGVEQAIDVAWDVLGGVADLHRQQIVHRDLKPGNVILRRNAGERTHAVIVDFGMSRFAGVDEHGEEVTALTRADIAVGTIEYMAPEQVLNSRGVTGTADIYAVGAMLYRAVIGQHVFDGNDDRAVLARQKMIMDPQPMATGRSDDLARGFEAIVDRMLRRLPAERYARAEDVLADLAHLRSGRPLLPEPAVLSEPAPALRSQPDLSPPPESSEPTHPLTFPTPGLALPPEAPPESASSRWLGIAVGVLLVASAAAGVGLILHRRASDADEPASITAVDEPSARAEPPAPSVAPLPPTPAPVAVALDERDASPDAEPARPKLAAAAEPATKRPPERPAKLKPSEPLASISAPSEPDTVEPEAKAVEDKPKPESKPKTEAKPKPSAEAKPKEPKEPVPIEPAPTPLEE